MSVKFKETSIQELQKAEAEKSKIITNATSADGVISMTINGGVATGTLVKFVSPCDCVGVTALNINGKSYAFVDSMGNTIAELSGGTGGVFVSGAVIAAVIDEESSNAYIQNAAKAKPTANDVDAVLTAAGWSGSEAPYTQTVAVSGVTADSNGTVGVSESATDAQYQSAMIAMLRKTAQADGSITVKAYGEKPTVNIPITVTLH